MLTQPEAAKKIKSELKAAFPKIKFSVTSSKGSSSYLHINYEDGLEYSNQIKKDVEKIAYANCSGWNLLINHNMSAGIKAEIESMISAYYKEPYNERNDSHRSLKMKIFNQEAMANLPVKKEPVAEVKEVINITEGLTGVVEKPADNDETTPVYCIECCEGYGNKPYAQGGAVDIENAIYFDSVESMQNAINLHRQGMRDFGGYDKHFVIVTMPTSGTSHKFRIDVSKKEEVYVKQELLDCFIGNKKFLESIKGSKMESPEHKQELSDYKWKIEKAVEWVNSKPEIKPEPIIDDVISAVDNKPNDNVWIELRKIIAEKHRLVSREWFKTHHESIPLDDCSIHGYENINVESIPGFLNLVVVDTVKKDELGYEPKPEHLYKKESTNCENDNLYQYEEGVASYEAYYQKYVDKLVSEGRYLELLNYRGWLDKVMDYIVL